MSTATQRLVGSSDQCVRQPDDFYETPAIATEELLKREKFLDPIWEPAVGAGAISKILSRHSYFVVGSDIRTENIYGDYPGRDFLGHGYPAGTRSPRSIITNPPFKLALPFILKALNEPGVEKVAIFGRIQLLESKERYERLWTKYPPVRIYVFSRRVTCSEEKVSIMCFCWFVWEKGFTGHPELHWIMPDKE
jgi:hypothetical protein